MKKRIKAELKRSCKCGCGHAVRSGQRFIRGHNFRGKKHSRETKEVLRKQRNAYLKKEEEKSKPHRLHFPRKIKGESEGNYRFRKFEFFCKNYVTHIAGKYAHKPVVLMAWQRDILKKLLGTLNGGKRIYKNMTLHIPRKNGKSFLTCLLIIYYLAELSFDDPACEIVSCASTKEQSKKTIFRTARLMVAYSQQLSQLIKIRTVPPSLTNILNHGIYEPLSSDAPAQLGGNVSLAIFDETHTQPNSELWDAIKTSQSMREQPLFVSISTAGNSRASFYYEIYEEAKKIQADPLVDPSTLVAVFEAPEDRDWRDPETFFLANPAIGKGDETGFRSGEDLKIELKKAIKGNGEAAFKQYFLNMWAQYGQRTLVRPDQWDLCKADDFDIQNPKERRVVGGVDLSSTTDLTAFGIIVEPDVGSKVWTVITWAWLAGENLQECSKRDRLPYESWVNQEVIYFEGKPTIQIEAVFEVIKWVKATFPKFSKVGYDPYLSSLLTPIGKYFELIPVAQQYSFLSPSLKTMKSKILDKEFEHNGDPLLRSCIENARVLTDPSGNIRLDKSKSTSRIDPLVALNIAATVALQEDFRR